MKLREIYNSEDIKKKISFEVFPPKLKENYPKLIEELGKLKSFSPAFVSLTWGAGGKNNNSMELVKKIIDNGLNVMPHFTCVCSTKDYVENHLANLNNLGIENILALRGDIPEDKSLCCDDFKYANELVEFIKAKSDLAVGVAGYPEGHIEAKNLKTDIENLKKKIDAGAEVIFTQLFFDNEKFYKYEELVRKSGINVPIIAGIMPILSTNQVNKMTSLAKISVPEIIKEHLNKDTDLQEFGIEYASKQCKELIEHGIDGLHFYTLNKSTSSLQILKNIL